MRRRRVARVFFSSWSSIHDRTEEPMEAAEAVDAQNAPTAPWKTHRTGFPQLPQAIIILATKREVTARLCHFAGRI